MNGKAEESRTKETALGPVRLVQVQVHEEGPDCPPVWRVLLKLGPYQREYLCNLEPHVPDAGMEADWRRAIAEGVMTEDDYECHLWDGVFMGEDVRVMNKVFGLMVIDDTEPPPDVVARFLAWPPDPPPAVRRRLGTSTEEPPPERTPEEYEAYIAELEPLEEEEEGDDEEGGEGEGIDLKTLIEELRASGRKGGLS